MKHARTLIPMEEGAIPHEVRVEALSSKARVRARLEEVMGRIKEREQQPADEEPPTVVIDFNDELDSVSNPD